ncbi:actin-binding LIM protein 3-like isoform X10 [Panulirus ornatus]|uniref:actin-binding LIM protein 3-like isoform X10 n=1 Tax=Panulirus ornatus TaxID=150431 RepID=UPI003A89C2B5
MVLLWTQHDGERTEPQPTDEMVQEHRKEGKENLQHGANKGEVSTSKPGETSPVPAILVEDLSVGVISEKHVVTLRQVSDLIDGNKSSAYVTPSVSPSTSSSVSASPSPPPSSCATNNDTVEEEEEEEVSVETLEAAAVESASRVALDKSSTLGPAVQLQDEEEEEEEEEGGKKKKKSHKRKFYTLPRNWKSKAADFILTKGCCKRQTSSASTGPERPPRSNASPQSSVAPAPSAPPAVSASSAVSASPSVSASPPPQVVPVSHPSIASFPFPAATTSPTSVRTAAAPSSVAITSSSPAVTASSVASFAPPAVTASVTLASPSSAATPSPSSVAPASPASAPSPSPSSVASTAASTTTACRPSSSAPAPEAAPVRPARSQAGRGPDPAAGRSSSSSSGSPAGSLPRNVATMGVGHHTITITTAAVPTTPIRRWKTLCESCGKKCSGEVLRVQEKYFHINCFKCHSCKKSLAQGGFFTREKDYYCTECYQKNFGQRCATCGLYVEGEVVSALGNSYHQKCFTCARCRQPFPTGERVTYTGKECLCQRCLHIPVVDSQSPARSPTTGGPKCAGCKEELVEGQALIALDQQWHIWCFKCAICSTVLHGEYMGKDGLPYCEKDYQAQFGVKCAYCNRFISGKVLQAGDNHHFHPTCARCTKCGDPFGDGEEMYLQGTAIWHPRCGPGPTENGTVLNGSLSNGHHINGEQKADRERDFDGMSSTASETQFSGPYRTCSPGLILREYKSSQSPIDITRIYTYSYLTAEPSQGYLKRPLDPYDRPPPKSPHFHRPPMDSRKLSLPKTSSKLGMKALVDQMQTDTPRPKSPHMNNEEPIVLSHYPGGRKPASGDLSRIERDDFPAPPYPYTDPDVSERRRRWSGSNKAVSIDETDEGTELEDDSMTEDPKLKREEVELSKIATGIGKVFLQQVKEREKIRAWKATHLDPRNASRSPAADREPGNKLRFGSSLNASPSRMTDHNRPWGPEDEEFDRGSSYRCSTGRSSATIPSYNVISALRGEPKPGYGLKSSTLPAAGRNGGPAGMIGDYSFTGLGDKTQSTEFSSARSDVSAGSLTEADRSALNAELCASATYSSGLRGYSSYSPHLRRSLPNMHHMSSEPPKIYPAHLLLVTNYRLPNDVDRCHLERHLSDTDFEMVFHMTRMDFYRLPEWRRNDLKRRAKLF